jgi:hypothetical protein
VDWVKLIADRARVSGGLRVDELAYELIASEAVVGNALRRQQERGLVEHLGKKIFINRLVPDFSGRELINMLRPEAYLSLETVLRDSGISTQSPTVLTCGYRSETRCRRRVPAEKPFAEKSRRMLWAEVTVFSSPAVSLSDGGTGSNLQAHSLLSLKKRDDLKQVASMWIAGRAKHAHQALRRAVRSLRQFGKSNRGIDEVPQNGLPSLHISGEKALDSFAEKFPAESRVPHTTGKNR